MFVHTAEDRYDTSVCCHSGLHSWFTIISQGDRMVIKTAHTQTHTHRRVNRVEQMDATNKVKGIATLLQLLWNLIMDGFGFRKKQQLSEPVIWRLKSHERWMVRRPQISFTDSDLIQPALLALCRNRVRSPIQSVKDYREFAVAVLCFHLQVKYSGLQKYLYGLNFFTFCYITTINFNPLFFYTKNESSSHQNSLFFCCISQHFRKTTPGQYLHFVYFWHSLNIC